MVTSHKALPYGGFIVCFHCWAYIEKEENEITRHLREEHGEDTKRGHGLYRSCKIIPEQVAIDLTDQETVDWFDDKDWDDGYNNPKANWATINEIKAMYQRLSKPVPSWVDNLVLPPTGAPENKYLVDDEEEEDDSEDEDSDELDSDQGGSEERSSDGPSGQGDNESGNANGTPVDDTQEEMNNAPVDVGDGNSSLEGTQEDIDGPAVDLPLIAKDEILGQVGPFLPPLAPGYKVYSCHECMDVHAHLQIMFEHHSMLHPHDLQARFAKVYNGRYFLQIARTTAIDGEEFMDRMYNMRVGMHLMEIAQSRYLTDDKFAYHCYLCGDDEYHPTRDFYEFDEHFATEHMEERFEIAKKVLSSFD